MLVWLVLPLDLMLAMLVLQWDLTLAEMELGSARRLGLLETLSGRGSLETWLGRG